MIDHEKPRVLWINSIVTPREKASAELLRTMQRIAKEKRVLIVAELNVSRAVEIRKDKRPQPKDVKCEPAARDFVDQFVLVYRDGYYEWKEEAERIEVFMSEGGKTSLPFDRKKYDVFN